MPRGVKPAGAGNLTSEQAKEKFLQAISKGSTVAAAAAAAQRQEKTYEYWRKTDPKFLERYEHARKLNAIRADKREDLSNIGFAEFSERFLKQKPYWHHLQWIDVLEGRPPRDLHPAETYEEGNPNRLLINCPPHHAKTSTITINYVMYRIAMNRDISIKLVSKSATKAMEFLHALKHYMTAPEFVELQEAFAPEGGWKDTASRWTNNLVYLERSSGKKDPTVEALGIGGQLYGSRVNLMILDDVVDTENAHQWENQLRWINRIVKSRLGRQGKLLIVGTRIAPIDLYRELRNPDHYSGGKSTYTYFAQPAVLEFADDPADWKTLWPRSSSPIEEGNSDEEADEEGMFTAWDGPSLASVRDDMPSADWAMVYMQQDAEETATFPEHAVKGCVNGMRRQGALKAGAAGHPERGQDGMYVIGSMDPSGSGDTAFLALAVDRESKKRYVLRCETISPWSWPRVTEIVKSWTEELDIREWVVEKNMFHSTFRQNQALSSWLAARGVRTKEHYTGSSKQDVDLGVASLAPLFGEWEADGRGHWRKVGEPLIELPGMMRAEAVKKLIEQLVTWAPKTKNKTDLVMALWFADLRARELVIHRDGRYGKSHLDNKYLTQYRASQRRVISIADYRQAANA